jgi:hypothetical protein
MPYRFRRRNGALLIVRPGKAVIKRRSAEKRFGEPCWTEKADSPYHELTRQGI